MLRLATSRIEEDYERILGTNHNVITLLNFFHSPKMSLMSSTENFPSKRRLFASDLLKAESVTLLRKIRGLMQVLQQKNLGKWSG